MFGFILIPSLAFGVGDAGEAGRTCPRHGGMDGPRRRRQPDQRVARGDELVRPQSYCPNWMEIVVSMTIITIGVQAFRWIVNRMPVLREHPAYGDSH